MRTGETFQHKAPALRLRFAQLLFQRHNDEIEEADANGPL